MAIEGYYYLHSGGDLIYKRDDGGAILGDFQESPFCVAYWPCDPEDRMTAWTILVEALAGGAKETEVKRLAQEWGCDDRDAQQYAMRANVNLSVTDDGEWCAIRKDFDGLVSPTGFGPTCLDALAELAKTLGYTPSKAAWGASFLNLVSR